MFFIGNKVRYSDVEGTASCRKTKTHGLVGRVTDIIPVGNLYKVLFRGRTYRKTVNACQLTLVK